MRRPGDLKKLNELDDFKVASGDPDPRGWDVASTDGREIGRVADLVVDMEAMKAKYLDISVDRTLDPSSERHLLVPTEAVTIGDREREQKRITLPVTSDLAMRTSDRSDALLAEPDRYAREWPAATASRCDVRLTRGGRNG